MHGSRPGYPTPHRALTRHQQAPPVVPRHHLTLHVQRAAAAKVGLPQATGHGGGREAAVQPCSSSSRWVCHARLGSRRGHRLKRQWQAHSSTRASQTQASQPQSAVRQHKLKPTVCSGNLAMDEAAEVLRSPSFTTQLAISFSLGMLAIWSSSSSASSVPRCSTRGAARQGAQAVS